MSAAASPGNSRDTISAASSAQGSSLPDSTDSSNGISKNEADADFDNLEIVDDSLKGKLAVLRVGSDPTENNLLSVFVGLKNRTPHPLPLEVQTIYKDKQGNQMNQGSWVSLTLKPHEETEYRSSSISVDAADFLVRIRRAATTGDN
jgi:hypothetical protein